MRSQLAILLVAAFAFAVPAWAQQTQNPVLKPLVPPSSVSISPVSSPSVTPPSTVAPASSSNSSMLNVQTNSQKVPAGTLLTIAFNTLLDSRTSTAGDPFTATLTRDFTDLDSHGFKRVILPVGTIIRGRLGEVKRPMFLSHGGALYLDFDHVVLPSGELLPLTLKLSSENTKVNQQGALYTDPGIRTKVHQGVEQGHKVFQNITQQGVKSGEQIAGGFGSIVTVPAAVVGGAFADAAVTTGKAAVAVFGKGESATIHPGDTMTIDFGGSFIIPSE